MSLINSFKHCDKTDVSEAMETFEKHGGKFDPFSQDKGWTQAKRIAQHWSSSYGSKDIKAGEDFIKQIGWEEALSPEHNDEIEHKLSNMHESQQFDVALKIRAGQMTPNDLA